MRPRRRTFSSRTRTGLLAGRLLVAGSLLAVSGAAQSSPPEAIGFHLIGPGANPTSGSDLCPHETPPFTHWDLRQFPGCQVPFEVNGAIGVTGNPTPAEAAAEVAAAATTWTAVVPAMIRLVDTSAQSATACNRAPTRDDRNCVAWDPNFGFASNVVGVTYLWRSGTSGALLESDISLNPVPAGSTWQLVPKPAKCATFPVGIQAVALHELGHFLGLHHPNQYATTLCGDDDPNDATVMYATYTDACEVQLSQPEIDGLDFLYTQDLGDHPDPPYTTRVHSGTPGTRVLSNVALEIPAFGPSHLFGIHTDALAANQPRYQYEWLGRKRTGLIDDHPQECDARALDDYDDGVSIRERCVDGVVQGKIRVTMHVRTASDVRGRAHDYKNAGSMYLNGWFDWNLDGDFRDPLEHAIGTGHGVAVRRAGAYSFRLQPPPDTPCGTPSRFRLDWREDAGQIMAVDPTLSLELGAAQLGEVEDYDPAGLLHPHNEYCDPQGGISVSFGESGAEMVWSELCYSPQPFEEGTETSLFFDETAVSECLTSTLCTAMDVDGDGLTDEKLCLNGPFCLERGAPVVGQDGLRVVPAEMVSLDVTGTSDIAGDLRVRLANAEGFVTLGEIHQTSEAAALGIDLSAETPAASFFDLFFVVESSLLGTSQVVGPVRFDAEIASVPAGELAPAEDPTKPPPAQPYF